MQEFFDRFQRDDSDLNTVSVPSDTSPMVSEWLRGSNSALAWKTLDEKRTRNALDLQFWVSCLDPVLNQRRVPAIKLLVLRGV